MSRLALGTAQFGLSYGIANTTGQVTLSAAKAMLELARQGGVDTIDTAVSYGNSERCLGELGTGGFKVVSKLPGVPEECPDPEDWIGSVVKASLNRLRVPSLYGLLLHRPQQLLGPHGSVIYRALKRLQETGAVRKIGVSVYTPAELDALLPRYQIDLVQAPFNIVDRRLHASGWLARLSRDGIEIHARSVFLQGLLLMPPETIPVKFAEWSDLWRTWHDWLREENVSPVDACLSFVLEHHEVGRVVVGADSPAQLAEILASSNRATLMMVPDVRCDSEGLINPARWVLL